MSRALIPKPKGALKEMSEESAKRAIEVLLRCYYENMGYELTKIDIQRRKESHQQNPA